MTTLLGRWGGVHNLLSLPPLSPPSKEMAAIYFPFRHQLIPRSVTSWCWNTQTAAIQSSSPRNRNSERTFRWELSLQMKKLLTQLLFILIPQQELIPRNRIFEKPKFLYCILNTRYTNLSSDRRHAPILCFLHIHFCTTDHLRCFSQIYLLTEHSLIYYIRGTFWK